MSDYATKDLEIAVKLALGKRMKEALLSGDTAEATKWATKLQEAEDLAATNSSQRAPHGSAPKNKVRPPTNKTRTASGSTDWPLTYHAA